TRPSRLIPTASLTGAPTGPAAATSVVWSFCHRTHGTSAPVSRAFGGFGGTPACHAGPASTFSAASCAGVRVSGEALSLAGLAVSSVATVSETGISPSESTTKYLSPTASGTTTTSPRVVALPPMVGPAPPRFTGGTPRSGPAGSVFNHVESAETAFFGSNPSACGTHVSVIRSRVPFQARKN